MNDLVTFQGGLGAASINERINALIAAGRLREVGTSATKPSNVPERSIDEVESAYGKPWYKRWWVWALAGTAVVGTGLTIYLVRRR